MMGSDGSSSRARAKLLRREPITVACLVVLAVSACGEGDSNEDGTGGRPGSGGGASSGGREHSLGQGGSGTPRGSGAGEGSGAASSSGGMSSGGASGGGGGLGGQAGEGGGPGNDCVDAVAPVARWTAYVVENDVAQPHVWAARSDTPDEPVHLFEAWNPISDLSWSPDGRWLTFVENFGPWSANMYLIDFAGGEPSDAMLVSADSYEVVGTPRWSADARTLVYAAAQSSSEGLRVVDLSTGIPSAAVAFQVDCPQGAYSELPCLAGHALPQLLEWSPSGDGLAIAFVGPMYADFGTGSAADLFVLDPSDLAAPGVMASPWVPNFGPVMRGVTAPSAAWSPDGTKLAYVGSFEDGSSVEEVYVFDLVGAGEPLKVHLDLAAPHQGALSRLAWMSDSTLLFAADSNAPGQQELFTVDVSDSAVPPAPQSLLSLPLGDTLLAFAPSPDESSLLVLSRAQAAAAATLVVHSHRDGELLGSLELSDSVTEVDGGFAASAQWFGDSSLLAFVEQEGGGMQLSVARRLADGSSCSAVSAPVSGPFGRWRWLDGEAAIVFSDEEGVHRLQSGVTSAGPLSAALEQGESLVGWAVQPRGVSE